MTGRGIAIAAAAMMAAWAAAPAWAQPGRFEVNGVRYEVPAPAGYCSDSVAVTGYKEAQRRVNPNSVPDVVFSRCGAETLADFDFFAITMPRPAMRITRPEMLAQMRRELPTVEGRDTIVSDSTKERLEQDLGRALDRGVSMKSGITPVGIDEFCGYIAGVISVAVSGAGTLSALVVGCATSTGGHAMYVLRYREGKDRAQAVGALPEVKALAQSIRVVR